MTASLRPALEARGARFGSEDDDQPRHFGDPGSELRSLERRCGWSVEHPGVLVATGRDFLDLLNRLSTNRVHDLAAGDARSTILTSPKGRIVARLWCHHLGNAGVLVLTGRGEAGVVVAHLAHYTFAEDTRVADASDRFATFVIRGPSSPDVAARLLGALPARDDTVERAVGATRVYAAGHDLLGGTGFAIVVDRSRTPEVLAALDDAVREAGGGPAGSVAVEPWRIAAGLPRAGSELDDEHNPLEAGLRDAVCFSKGCYVGQEVVARLETYDKVSRRLMVVRPSDPATPKPGPGASLTRGGRTIGTITSVAPVPGTPAWIALAYVKRARGRHGATVEVAGPAGQSAEAVVLDPPVDPLA